MSHFQLYLEKVQKNKYNHNIEFYDENFINKIKSYLKNDKNLDEIFRGIISVGGFVLLSSIIPQMNFSKTSIDYNKIHPVYREKLNEKGIGKREIEKLKEKLDNPKIEHLISTTGIDEYTY